MRGKGVIMTLEDLQKLDSYGHKLLQDLTTPELQEYLYLLENRAIEVSRRLLKGSEKRKRVANKP